MPGRCKAPGCFCFLPDCIWQAAAASMRKYGLVPRVSRPAAGHVHPCRALCFDSRALYGQLPPAERRLPACLPACLTNLLCHVSCSSRAIWRIAAPPKPPQVSTSILGSRRSSRRWPVLQGRLPGGLECSVRQAGRQGHLPGQGQHQGSCRAASPRGGRPGHHLSGARSLLHACRQPDAGQLTCSSTSRQVPACPSWGRAYASRHCVQLLSQPCETSPCMPAALSSSMAVHGARVPDPRTASLALGRL